MSTFLQLCQKVARESGTVSGTQPTAVTGQTGRLGKIVHWTAQAWRDIQNARSAWRWMRDDWSSTLTGGTGRYTSSSFSLTRWADWIVDTEHERGVMSIYLTATGVSDESEIYLMDWLEYRKTYERGTQTNDRPLFYSVSPAGELCFGPIPDATYTVLGEYRKTAQELSADGDTPELPTRFHDLIAWKGLILLGEHDEGEIALATATRKYRELLDALERDQLPRPSARAAGPLA